MADVGIQLNYRPLNATALDEVTENGTFEWQVQRVGQEWAVPYTRADDLGPVRKERPAWHYEGDEPRNLQPFEQELVDIINEFVLEPDEAKRNELMREYNRIFTENVYNVGVVIGRYGLALAKRFQNIPIASPTFLYHWTWGNVSPEQVWVMPEEQLDQIQPGVIPTYGE
jgi:peptide/nickel transport system substrate-binding protein